VPVALAAAVLSSGVGCHSWDTKARDAKAMTAVRSELALLKAPEGYATTDESVGLGEMYAEGSRQYCVADEKAGQVALDAMFRDAGWKPLSTAATPDGTSWRYGKDGHLGTLHLEAAPQPCGHRFRVELAEAL
jgi:hypothetical protein